MRWVLVAAGLATTMVPRPAYTQTAAVVLRQAEQRYASVRTLTAQFTQTLINPMLGGPEESRGVLHLEPPSRFAMRFTHPAGDRIVADGTWLWAYAPSTVPNQVIRQPVPVAGAASPNLIAQFVERPLERYTAELAPSGTVEGRPVAVVRLRPLERGMPFAEAIVSFSASDSLPHRIELLEVSGQRRIIVLRDITLNARVDAAEFRFEVPRGVRVVTP